MSMQEFSRCGGLGLLVLVALTACGPTGKEWEPDKKEPKVFSMSTTQTAPQPVYSRLRWVHLPEPLPSRQMPESGAPQIYPVFHMQLKNTRLEDVARLLASTARYSSYCASTVADKKVTVNRLGTIDELAQYIQQDAGVRVVVDHENKQVRFMAGGGDGSTGTRPRFSDSRG